MKLRMTNSSIRLRLSQSDVQRFGESGIVKEVLRFGARPDEAFSYSIRRDADVRSISATLDSNGLIVSIPIDEAADWTGTERVGIVGEQSIDDGSVISLLVEKDFACLTPRAGDDDRDSFPHPGKEANC
jgi:hypothetical protein